MKKIKKCCANCQWYYQGDCLDRPLEDGGYQAVNPVYVCAFFLSPKVRSNFCRLNSLKPNGVEATKIIIDEFTKLTSPMTKHKTVLKLRIRLSRFLHRLADKIYHTDWMAPTYLYPTQTPIIERQCKTQLLQAKRQVITNQWNELLVAEQEITEQVTQDLVQAIKPYEKYITEKGCTLHSSIVTASIYVANPEEIDG